MAARREDLLAGGAPRGNTPQRIRFELTENLDFESGDADLQGRAQALYVVWGWDEELGKEGYITLPAVAAEEGDDDLVIWSGVGKLIGVEGDRGWAEWQSDSQKWEVTWIAPQRHGTLNAGLTYVDGTESVEVSIYVLADGAVPGGETDPGYNVTAYCRMLTTAGVIASGSWVTLTQINGYWQITTVGCPAP